MGYIIEDNELFRTVNNKRYEVPDEKILEICRLWHKEPDWFDSLTNEMKIRLLCWWSKYPKFGK